MGGHPHWAFDAQRLGEDEHGVWLGCPAGHQMTKPGTEVVLPYSSTLVIPHAQPWTAAFNADIDADLRAACEVYIDIATPAEWSVDGRQVTCVDLDLDVVRRWEGTVFVDDEDEFTAQPSTAPGSPKSAHALSDVSA